MLNDDGTRDGKWWETDDGGHIEPAFGAIAGLNETIAGHQTEFSKGIRSGQNFFFGNGENPGILGTGQYKSKGAYQPGDTSGIQGYDGFQNAYAQRAGQVQGWGQNQIGNQQDQFRQQQSALANALAARAYGNAGPSAAEMQMRQGGQQQVANALALAATQRSANSGNAAYGFANQRAGINQQTGGDINMLRSQEQMQARDQLGQLLQGQRTQDLGMAQGQAQLDTQQRQAQDAITQQYLQQGMSLAEASAKARVASEQLQAQSSLEQEKRNASAYASAAGQNQTLVGDVVKAIAIGSDERIKTKIRSGDEDAHSFLEAVQAARGDKKLREKEPEGAQLGRGLGAMLAAQAAMHKRLKALESD